MQQIDSNQTNSEYSDFQIDSLKTYLREVTVVSVVDKVDGELIEIAQVLHGFVELDETLRFSHDDVVISSPIQISSDHNTQFITKSGSQYMSCDEVEYVTLNGQDWLKMRQTLMNPRDILIMKYLS
ncbi:hypothetical protein [Pseudoalteromonas sp. BSi20439]|jgi:hypothetical protein|uniref:hypothetical protein n=1 Tax=Pseudoalteromonas sp. BSi20439 TaxID=420915 RepID=UPI000231A355|nr:hypothetical protein [Pseudoalteromonas sp. BSi20439]GAA71325.1 hypothetical protein P20439_1398 [Pseudoalteromonas sp. BSi20439]